MLAHARELHRTLAYGPATIALSSRDTAAADWLLEVLQPWFAPTPSAADWHVRLSSSRDAYADLSARRPLDAAPRACFALDQEVVSFPAWPTSDGLTVSDAERSCFLRITPFEVDLTGDPRTRRWRFTSMWVCQEIAATRLRRTQLDVHAAAVEAAGRAILIVGPKGAGKTTLSLHLLRSGRCRMMANDRTFVGRAGTSVVVRGMPTAVKVRPPTLAGFPELRRGLPPVERPYLHTLDELASMVTGDGVPESTEFALSPAQVAHQLRVEPLGTAPLGAIVFPHIRTDVAGWDAERLAPKEVSARILANLYGGSSARFGSTIFEDLDGGRSLPSRRLSDELAEAAPGYRLAMGQHAYAEPSFSERLLETLLPS